MGCHFLLQGIFQGCQGTNPGLLHCRQMLYHLNHQGSPERTDPFLIKDPLYHFYSFFFVFAIKKTTMPAFNVALTFWLVFSWHIFFCPVVLIILYHYDFSFSMKIITEYFSKSAWNVCLFFFEYLFIWLCWVLVVEHGLSCTMHVGS